MTCKISKLEAVTRAVNDYRVIAAESAKKAEADAEALREAERELLKLYPISHEQAHALYSVAHATLFSKLDDSGHIDWWSGIPKLTDLGQKALEDHDAEWAYVSRSILEGISIDELIMRLNSLSEAVTEGPDSVRREFTMSVPARPNRDADLVLSTAAQILKRLQIALQTGSEKLR